MVSGNVKTTDNISSTLFTKQTKTTNTDSKDFGVVMNQTSKQNSNKSSNDVKTDNKVDVKNDEYGSTKNEIKADNETNEDNEFKLDNLDSDKDIKKFDEAMSKLKEETKGQKETAEAASSLIVNLVPIDVLENLPVEDVQKAIESISKELGISTEELTSYLDNNKLNVLDLNNPKNALDLVLNVKGIDDTSLLLTDSKLGEEVKNLLENIKEITTKLQAAVPENISVPVEQETVNKLNKELNQNTSNSKNIEQKIVSTDTNVVSGDEVAAKISEMSKSETRQNDSQTNENNQSLFGNGQMLSTSNQIVEGLANAIAGTSDNMSQAEIISQVIEQVKTQFKPDMTSMELQLYPEHLGKVSISVIAKDGAITAQIAAETETAKVAMESQLSTLKDALNNQGVKVEAVEVTVASHNFDENLNNGDSSQKENEHKNGRVRKSLLDELNGDDAIILGDISEEAKMETIGNTVSYKA